MRNAKLILFLIICACGGYFVYQNLPVFTHPVDLKVDIVNRHYEWLQIQSFAIFLSFFAAGFIVAFFLGLGARLKTGKTLKLQKAELTKVEKELSELQKAAATAAAATAAATAAAAVAPAPVETAAQPAAPQGVAAEADTPGGTVKDKTENAG